jgi:hypothetical protein
MDKKRSYVRRPENQIGDLNRSRSLEKTRHVLTDLEFIELFGVARKNIDDTDTTPEPKKPIGLVRMQTDMRQRLIDAFARGITGS